MTSSIKIPDNLEHIVKSIDIRKNLLIIKLGVIYDGKTAIVGISPNFSMFERDFDKRLKKLTVDEQHIFQMFSLIQENHKIIYPGNIVTGTITPQKNSEKSEVENINISFDDWYPTLNEKYTALKNTCEQNFPQVWPTFEFALSIKGILHILDITLPFAGIILGPPSSFKTLALEMLRESPLTFYTDSFTAKSFVSHNTSVSQEQLQKIDMLPKIKDKVFITPELAPVFSAKDDDLLQALGIITRIMDGHGYESDSGAYGHRGYSEDTMFTWIGAAVDIPRKVYKHLGALGPKLYFYRVPNPRRTTEEYLNELLSNNFNQRRDQVKEKLKDYLDWFNRNPYGTLDRYRSSESVKVKWDSSGEKEVIRHIVRLGKLLAPLRGVSVTWETGDTGGSNYGYTTPILENPSRAMTSLMNLARGHAMLTGRNYLSIEDIPILIKTVLSTAPLERVLIFDLLLNREGTLSTRQVKDFLRISGPTALKTMRELHVLGLVDFKEEDLYKQLPATITLKEEFDWFLSDEFKQLRDGYSPGTINDVKDHQDSKEMGVKKNYPHLNEEVFTSRNIDQFTDTEKIGENIELVKESASIIACFFEYAENQASIDECKEKLPPYTSSKFIDGNVTVSYAVYQPEVDVSSDG